MLLTQKTNILDQPDRCLLAGFHRAIETEVAEIDFHRAIEVEGAQCRKVAIGTRNRIEVIDIRNMIEATDIRREIETLEIAAIADTRRTEDHATNRVDISLETIEDLEITEIAEGLETQEIAEGLEIAEMLEVVIEEVLDHQAGNQKG